MYILGWQYCKPQRMTQKRKDKNMRKERGSAAVTPKTDALEEFEKFNHSVFYIWCKKQLTENVMFSDMRGGRSNGDVSDASDNKNTQKQVFNSNKYYNNNGFTMEHEMECYCNNNTNENNLENSFIVCEVKPKRGDAVLFSHKIIHRACSMSTRKTANIPKNTNKNSNNIDSTRTSKSVCTYALKTEIVMKRYAKIRKKYQQFAISSYESKDYINYKASNGFYKLCLSPRYLYHVQWAIDIDLINNENNSNNHNNRNRKKLIEIPFDISKVIFNYTSSSASEVEIVSLLFPDMLYPIITMYRRQQNQFDNSNLNDNYYDRLKSDIFKHQFNPLTLENKQFDNLPLYILNLLMQYVSFNLFEFRDVTFYNKHTKQCNSLITMYSLYLFGNSSKYNYYVLKYNSFTQNIMIKCVSLFQLLKDLFYSRNCLPNQLSILARISTIEMNDNDSSSNIAQLILYMIHKFYKSHGNSFLWHPPTDDVIIGNLLKKSSTFDASLNFLKSIQNKDFMNHCQNQ